MSLYVVSADGVDWLTFVVRAADEAEAERLAEPRAKDYLRSEYEGVSANRALDPEGSASILLEIAA
jgi:hypothetical protein